MAGYLEEYGVADERRTRVIRWLVISAAVLVIGALVLYFTLRTWPAQRQVRAFLGDLSRQDYRAAYRDWGCAQPCRDYPFDQFLEDWGPKSGFANASAATIKRSRYCSTGGVIVTLLAPKGEDVYLWYQGSDGTLGFAPWQGLCNPHVPAPTSAPAP